MNKKYLSSSSIKFIAITAMLIDHIGVIILENVFVMNASYHYFSDAQFDSLLWLVNACNLIGSLAFPLFCFLLVEGLVHTKNLKKYFLSLLVGAILTEPIYDWSLSGSWLDWSGQNALFTLLLGLSMLILLKKLKGKWLLSTSVILCSAIISYVMRFDGWYFGILLISIFYLFRESYWKYLFSAIVTFICGLNFTFAGFFDPYFLASFITLLIIYFYNGKRGLSLKYSFYLFYPGHLFMLKIISILLIKFAI